MALTLANSENLDRVTHFSEEVLGLDRRPDLSIIVPTRNEADNVRPLLERIEQATKGLTTEVIFVDDSTDDTPEVVRSATEDFGVEVGLVARPPERRNGLGKAVVEGMRVAQADWLCVMDGDLQHPPEVIPQLLDRALNSGATLVAASRLTEGGGTEGLSFRRKLISYGLALLSQLVFPKRLRQVSDPLTGFFVVHRDALNLDELEPEGFKILLEVLVRSPRLNVDEIPFEFGERHAGESKANSHEAILLFKQMFRLCLGTQKHLLRFMGVGALGFVVNTVLLAMFTELGALHYLLSAVLATQGSSLWNFVGTEMWVFRDRPQQREHLGRRLVSYMALNNAALLVRGPLLFGLVALGLHYLWANAVSLGVLLVLRFMISERLIWRSETPTLAPEAALASTAYPTEGL